MYTPAKKLSFLVVPTNNVLKKLSVIDIKQKVHFQQFTTTYFYVISSQVVHVNTSAHYGIFLTI